MDTIIEKLTPSLATARFVAVLALSTMFIWFGSMTLNGTSAGNLTSWLNSHPILKGTSNDLQLYFRYGLGGLQLLAGVLVALHAVPGKFKQQAYWAIVLISVGALSLLFTNPVWIDSLGGFPAIGRGQGLLKYVAIAGVALWLASNKHGETVMLLGLIIVLGWIGAMKFTGPEADGIHPLLTSSPVFNWWAPVYFSKQMASNIIGVIELVTVLCLTGWWWNKRLCQLGLLMTALTCLVTLSFLITFKASWTGGFPYLSGAGHFLLKDLALLAATLALLAENKVRG